MKDCSKPWSFAGVRQLHSIPIEVGTVSKSDYENPLTMLGDEARRVDNPMRNRVTQFFCQGSLNCQERPSTVVRCEILDVFENKESRTMEIEYACDFEKQGSLGVASETVRATE
jgi:hypothetical protein